MKRRTSALCFTSDSTQYAKELFASIKNELDVMLDETYEQGWEDGFNSAVDYLIKLRTDAKKNMEEFKC